MGQKPLVSVLRAVRGVGKGGAAVHVAYFWVVGGQGVKTSTNTFLSILFCFDVLWESVGKRGVGKHRLGSLGVVVGVFRVLDLRGGRGSGNSMGNAATEEKWAS